MQIATWNVRYGLGPANLVRLERMRAVDADIWVLTETHDDLSLDGSGYDALHAEQRPVGDGTNRNVVEGSRWVTIWSRIPIISRRSNLADPHRAVACTIAIDGGELTVYGTVLPWYTDNETDGMDVVLPVQAEEWAGLPHGASCVAGDFNVNLGGPHYYGSNKSKVAVAEALAAASLVPVTDFEHTPGRSHGLIDHIALSPDLANVGREVTVFYDPLKDGKHMSDHCGVAVTVRPG